jgi:hypothetical protein
VVRSRLPQTAVPQDRFDHVCLWRFDELLSNRHRLEAWAIKVKGHAQQLGWSQRNSESNAKTIGARTASDGEFVFSTTVKASKDEASHDCRGRIRAEFDRLVRTATPIEFFRSVSETPEGGILPVEPSADVRKMPNTQLAR